MEMQNFKLQKIDVNGLWPVPGPGLQNGLTLTVTIYN